MKHKTLEWKQTNTETAVKTPWSEVQQRSYVLPDGSKLEDYTILKEPDGVTIVAQTDGGKILLVKQYRPAPNGVRYDFPGGAIDQEEGSALEAAKRELLEETGYQSDDWTEIGKVEPAPHRLATSSHGFLAVNCRKVAEPKHEQTEFIEVELLTPAEIEKLIYSNEFCCGICVTTYFLAKHAFFSRQCEVCL